MISVKEAVIVEGRYDKARLESVVDAIIVTTEGFGIFKDEKKRKYIKKLAETVGIIILTDSDGAGSVIRNHVKSIAPAGRVVNIYSPRIFGKEKRKTSPSKEGYLGVEGIDTDLLQKLFGKYGVAAAEKKEPFLDGARLYRDGLSGGSCSAEKRRRLLILLGLPDNLSAKAMTDAINSTATEKEYIKALEKLEDNSMLPNNNENTKL